VGWLSKIISPVIKVAAGVFLGEEAAAAIGSAIDDEPEKQIEKAATIAVAGTSAAGITIKPSVLRSAGAAIDAGVPITVASTLMPVTAGGAMPIMGTKNIVTTLVQTRNALGQLIRTETLRGAPFLMKTDITAAKRVHKKFVKLGQKLPRRTVKQSTAAKLTEAIQDKAMQQIMGPSCPPKC